MTKEIRFETIKPLRDLIADEKNAFSMEHTEWTETVRVPKDSHKGACGTPACLAGWASTFSFKHENLPSPAWGQMIMPHLIVGSGVKTYSTHPEWFTRKRTLAMLDHFIEKGLVDWLALENGQA